MSRQVTGLCIILDTKLWLCIFKHKAILREFMQSMCKLVILKLNIFLYVFSAFLMTCTLSIFSCQGCPMDFSCIPGGYCVDGRCSCPSGYTGYKCQIRKHLNINFNSIPCHILILFSISSLTYK